MQESRNSLGRRFSCSSLNHSLDVASLLLLVASPSPPLFARSPRRGPFILPTYLSAFFSSPFPLVYGTDGARDKSDSMGRRGGGGWRRGDGTDLKQHGRQSDPKVRRRERMPGLKREQRAGDGTAGKINGDVRSTFLRPDVGSFHLPRAGRDRLLRGRDCRAAAQPRHEIFAC